MDENLEATVKDLRVLIMLLFYDSVRRGVYTDVQIPVRDYLAANEKIIKKGLDAVRQMARAEVEGLRVSHNLHHTVAHDPSKLCDYNYEIIDEAVRSQRRDPNRSFPHPDYDDSKIEPLMRMLEYAVFVADTSEFSLEMSPVVEYLPATVIERRKDKLKPYMGAV